MKRAIYLPLNIAILCGLVLSVFAASPVVYGDNVPSCQGNGSSGAKVTLAGRVITPTTLLRTANGQPCRSNETGLNLVSIRRTLIVSPNGTPTQNGTALLDAMTAISNTSPSASNPWLLKLEPGNYDVGGSLLVLKPYVDLEGSGQDSTTISSTVTNTGNSPNQGALVVASNSEVRFLSLAVNSASTNISVGILVNGGVVNARLSYLSINAAGGNFNYAVLNYGGNILIQDSSLNATNSAHGAFVIYNTNGATLKVQDSVLNGAGIYSSYAIYNSKNNTTSVQNSTLNVSAGNGNSILSAAIYNTESTTTVYNSVLKSANSGTGSSGSFGVWNSTNGVITIRNSYLKSSAGQSSYGLLNAGGTAKVAASQLSGSSGNINGSGIICVASYNGNFSPLNTSCG